MIDEADRLLTQHNQDWMHAVLAAVERHYADTRTAHVLTTDG